MLSEFLYLAAEAGPEYLAKINNSALYDCGDFDKLAAIELATLHLKFDGTKSSRTRKRERRSNEATRAKIKFDRQIVAICKVKKVRTLYSDDKGVKTFAERNGIHVVRTWELPVPSGDKQLHFEQYLNTQGLESQQDPEES